MRKPRGGAFLPPLLADVARGPSCVRRYVVRLDEGDSHLRNGAVGAFGLVHAAAACDVLQAGSAAGPLDIDTVVGPGLFYTGQSMILFAFAAAAVEAAFRWGVVRRFGAPPPQQQQQQ